MKRWINILFSFAQYLSKEMCRTPPPYDIDTIDNALDRFGLTKDMRTYVYKVLAGVLLIGNITFEDTEVGCSVTKVSEDIFTNAANLFGIDATELKDCLTSRPVVSLK